ncbi:MAG: GNAT family N-acetyltransferase [Gracilibacteraceae bacterium]|jgi:GNAT superfamily N-acetyltransferase|nr:GNAT family N-acetyltransferase [Gracilibacteraceae bacterium]
MAVSIEEARLINVTDDNFEFFAPFLPAGVGEARPRRQADPNVLRLGCAVAETAVGALETELRESAACVLSLAVSPSWRRQGLGSFMLRELLDLLRETGSVQVWALAPSWADSAAALPPLFTGAGFQADGADSVYTYSLTAARERPLIQKMVNKEDDPHILSLAAAPDYLLRLLDARITAEGGAEGLAAAADIDRETSVIYHENGEAAACLLFAADPEGLEARWLHGGTPGALSAVVASGVRRALERYKTELPVRITAVHPSVDDLVVKLLGEPQAKEFISAYRVDL